MAAIPCTAAMSTTMTKTSRIRLALGNARDPSQSRMSTIPSYFSSIHTFPIPNSLCLVTFCVQNL